MQKKKIKYLFVTSNIINIFPMQFTQNNIILLKMVA